MVASPSVAAFAAACSRSDTFDPAFDPLVSGELRLQAKQPLLVAILQQFMDESRGGIEADRQPLLAGCETEPETDVGLACAAVADRNDILPAGYILRAGELQNESLVERRNGGEVEAIQALHGREPRLLDPPLDHPLFAVDQLQFGQAQQKTDVIEALGGALPSELVVLAQERRQP